MDPVMDLAAIGFTEYEAKVYVALLRDSPATGYQIGKQAGVPRSMVYEALGRLEARGAVLKAEDRRATLYRPVPPEALLDRYEQEQQQLLESLRDSLYPLFHARPEDYLWTIRGREAVFSYAAQMIDQAQDELLVVLTDEALEALRAKLNAADKRQVSIGALLTGTGQLHFGQVAHHPPIESELHQLTDMVVVVSDSTQALIASTSLDTSATITQNHNLVLITRQFVWMELFAQRINATIGPDLLHRLDEQDRIIFESYPDPINDPSES